MSANEPSKIWEEVEFPQTRRPYTFLFAWSLDWKISCSNRWRIQELFPQFTRWHICNVGFFRTLHALEKSSLLIRTFGHLYPTNSGKTWRRAWLTLLCTSHQSQSEGHPVSTAQIVLEKFQSNIHWRNKSRRRSLYSDLFGPFAPQYCPKTAAPQLQEPWVTEFNWEAQGRENRYQILPIWYIHTPSDSLE